MDNALNEIRDRAFIKGIEAAENTSAKSVRPFKTKTLQNRIDAFEKAVKDHAFKGTHPPEDHAILERKLFKARLALINYVIDHCI